MGLADSASGITASGKLRQRVRLLFALVIVGVVVTWAGRVVWENRNSTVAAAQHLRSSDKAQRLEAVQEVSMQGLQNPTDGIPALIGALEDKDEKVRVAAAKALGFLTSYTIRSNAHADVVRQAATALRASMKDPAPAVRIESARSLGILGGIGFAIPRRGAAGTPKKSANAANSPVDARVLADVFKELAGDPDAGARLLVWQALGSVGPRLGIELPQELLAGVETEPSGSREAVIKTLSEYGPAARPAVPFLCKLLREDAPTQERSGEAEHVARALGRIAPGSPAAGEAVASLTAALKSSSPAARLAAIKALEQLVRKMPPARFRSSRLSRKTPTPRLRRLRNPWSSRCPRPRSRS